MKRFGIYFPLFLIFIVVVLGYRTNEGLSDLEFVLSMLTLVITCVNAIEGYLKQ